MPARLGGFQPVSSVDVVPDRRLELEPVIEAPNDVAAALEETAYLDSREATVNAACAQAVRDAQKRAADKLFTVIDDGDGKAVTVSFADRRASLEKAIREAVPRMREQLFDGDCKTRKFNFGKVSFAESKKSLSVIKGKKEKQVVDLIIKKSRLKSKIGALLAGKLEGLLKVFGRPVNRMVRVKYELNKADLKADYLEGLLSTEELNELLLEITGGTEELSIEVFPYVIRSEQSAA